MKKYLTEFLGTFILTMVVIASIFTPAGMPTAFLVGITLSVLVIALGSISGAHVNPGITFGAMVVGKISKKDGVWYVIAQLLGGAAAFLVAKAFGHTMPQFDMTFSLATILSEIVGMTIFSFGVASAVYKTRGEAATAVLVGGSLLIGAYISGGLKSFGVLNPAISVGVGLWNVSYLVGPLVGGMLGMMIYKYLYSNKA